MYKALSATDFIKFLKLPDNYRVDGFISYGAWDDNKHFTNIQKTLDNLKVKYTARKMPGFFNHVLEIKIKKNIFWFAVVYGGALLSEYLHLACLFGSKKNIHIGSCGGLYPKMNSLDLLIPTYSYAIESSTSIYDRGNKHYKYFSNKRFSKMLMEKIPKNYKVWSGPIMTCQAMIGETLEDIKDWSKKGYYGVEMESATVFSVSNHFKVPSTSLMYVGDNLIKGQTVGSESHLKERANRIKVKNEVYKIAFMLMLDNK